MAVDLNIKFINIDSIKEAIGKAEKEDVRVKAKEIKSRPEISSARKAKANISKSIYREVINLDWLGVDSSKRVVTDFGKASDFGGCRVKGARA